MGGSSVNLWRAKSSLKRSLVPFVLVLMNPVHYCVAEDGLGVVSIIDVGPTSNTIVHVCRWTSGQLRRPIGCE